MLVYASWNGATEVARWQVLAGDADALRGVASRRRDGFETAITARAQALRGRCGRSTRAGACSAPRGDPRAAECGCNARSPCGPRPRGFHLVTREVLEALPELGDVRTGLLHLFIRHTSASLTLNENASPDVRDDFESYFNEAVPEDAPYWTHTIEGPDDMPAHIKASLLGPSLTLPVGDGRLALGTWQGVYLCEHRDRGGARSLLATLEATATVAPRRGAQRPCQTGSRFSANAVAPSRASSEPDIGPAISPWRSHASSSVQSCGRARICFERGDGQRAVGDDRGGQLARDGDRLAGLGEPVDDPDLVRALGADRVAGQRQLHREVVRDPLRQPHQRAGRGDQRRA